MIKTYVPIHDELPIHVFALGLKTPWNKFVQKKAFLSLTLSYYNSTL